MGERRALGVARRARRVLDVDRVVELQPGLALGELLVADTLARRQELLPVVLEHDRLTQFRAGAAHVREHAHVVGLAEAAGEDEHAHAGLLQRVGELTRLVRRIDGDEDRSDARGRELRHDPLVAVGRPDAHALTHADSMREQCARRDVDLIPELVIGRAVALVRDDECLAPAELRDRPAQAFADGLAEQRKRARAVRVRRGVQWDRLTGEPAIDLDEGSASHGENLLMDEVSGDGPVARAACKSHRDRRLLAPGTAPCLLEFVVRYGRRLPTPSRERVALRPRPLGYPSAVSPASAAAS